jgi:hypothetical protein
MTARDHQPLLARIEAYYDAAPRVAARVEEWPPLRLFANDGASWPFYARPIPGATGFTPVTVERVRARQRELGIPESFEWVEDLTPGLAVAATAAGLTVRRLPLMVLEAPPRPPLAPPAGIELRLATPDDDVATVIAVAAVAFGAPGTAAGPAGPDAVAEAARAQPPAIVEFVRDRLRRGRTVTAVALAGRDQHAAALTDMLARDALARGIETVFLTAGDAVIARVYERIGFRTLATGCIAEPG